MIDHRFTLYIFLCGIQFGMILFGLLLIWTGRLG